ncbi:S-adenosylmethionine:tRNA ribosyltransferase-isomerase [Desulfuromonas versatilis]|uniref:S-adenosylmethionine:tRNA ribosyltransferase-isomerase n=2 Tax=Desulfuromonas versatilis TaxID=2802975 RepID=A0ABN6DZB7_9BACT|nr:S-adenosylmethionine:tRNA ribosyltransferase-isomerase [Desulfuromonas versatilis]
MTLDRKRRRVQSGKFSDIVDHFRSGDVLVYNDTKVIPARLLGSKQSGGKVEVFLVRRLVGEHEDWVCLTKCSKTPRPGTQLLLGNGELEGEVLEGGEPPFRHVRFHCRSAFGEVLERVGRIPLPPYIRRDDEDLDRDRYQTVFASSQGAVAAPTAGLHFTEPILAALREKGVRIVPVTLHVGLGTFFPVRTENLLEHQMHGEVFTVPETTAEEVNRARREGRRVVALGTTTTRTLEYSVDDQGRLLPGQGVTDLFIYPGFEFRIVDALVTNFHLPQSTLLVLVSAFAGRDFVLEAYRQAVREGYRFFSYGDCMLIA